MMIGSVWYAKSVFGKMWMERIGKKEEDLKEGMGGAMAVSIIGGLITAYVLSYFVDYAQASTWQEGALTGFWAWLGFVVTVLVINAAYERRSKKLVALYAGYQLITLLVMGAILAACA